MPEASEDFWPPELPDPSDPAPVALLKEQAEFLGSKTNGEIEGIVRMMIENGTAYHTLYLKAKLVGDVTVGVLTISYPAFSDPRNIYPILADSFGEELRQGTEVKITSDEEFRKWLRDKLSSDRVRDLIGVLKKYIREIRETRAAWAD